MLNLTVCIVGIIAIAALMLALGTAIAIDRFTSGIDKGKYRLVIKEGNKIEVELKSKK